MHDRIDAFDQMHHRLPVRQIDDARFLMRRRLAQLRNVADTNDIGPVGERAAQLAAQIAGCARQKQAPERLLCGIGWVSFGSS